MERTVYQQLLSWKTNPRRKPLILMGARQVGKTYVLRQFGNREYRHVAYINCDNNRQVSDLFAGDFDMSRILLAIGAVAQVPVVPGQTLIILDEVQELDRGLAALKYFCELAPEHHVAVAGSLLGLTLHRGQSAPVGKVDIVRMYPMTFDEYLLASGREAMVELLRRGDYATVAMMRAEYDKLLRQYYFVGGMPEAVATFVDTGDAMTVRQVQQNILAAYGSDMSKHTTAAEAVRISQVWQSVPSQLARDNKKFLYGALKQGARAREYEQAIQWLHDAGLVHRLFRAAQPQLPLKFYEDMTAFKLYLLDVGLLGALGNTPPAQLLVKDNALGQSKGAFTENFVVSQLATLPNATLCYYSSPDSRLEIDLLVQAGERVWPVEVKAEENLRAKSLRTYVTAHPGLRGVRLSMSDYRDQDWMVNVPLYACRAWFEQWWLPHCADAVT